MEWTSVALLTRQHLFTGEVPTDGNRMLEVLNDQMTDYVRLSNGELYRAQDTAVPAFTFTQGVVSKHNIYLAMIAQDRHEAPAKRNHYFIKKRTSQVFMTVPGYEVQGTMHMTQFPDTATTISRVTRENQPFFPLTEATAYPIEGQGEPLSAKVILVNRNSVVLFLLGVAREEVEEKEPDSPD